MAPVQWMQRALPEATLMVQRKNRKGEIDELPDHLMLALIQNPNPHYGDIVLWWGYVLSMALDGNDYGMIVRNGLGRPAELWYIPPWLIEPKMPGDGSDFILSSVRSPGGGGGAAPKIVVKGRGVACV